LAITIWKMFNDVSKSAAEKMKEAGVERARCQLPTGCL
jgi:hypothetical protein